MATVYKSDSETGDDNRSHVSGLAGFNLQDLADEGRERLNDFQRQGEQLLADARIEAERIRQEAYQSGYDAGHRQAEQEASQRIETAAIERSKSGLDMVQSAVDELHDQHQQWMQAYAESLNTVALAAAERIVRRELSVDPQMIVRWVQQAVTSARAACQLTVAVNPETLALLGSSLDEMLSSHELPEKTFVVPDLSVGPTEVVVRQTGGEIQAGLNAQLERLEEMLS